MNLTLRDVKYNLLRSKRSEERDKKSTTFSWLLCGSTKSKCGKAFGVVDYRRRLVCTAINDEYICKLHAGVYLQPLNGHSRLDTREFYDMSKADKRQLKSTYSKSPYRDSFHSVSVRHIGSVSETEKNDVVDQKCNRSNNLV